MKLLRFLLPVLLVPLFLTALHAQSNTTATIRPYIISVSPSIIPPGSPQTTITIYGKRFQQGLEVYFSSQKLSEVFLTGDSLIHATIPASLLIQPGQATLLVVNPDQTAIGFNVAIGHSSFDPPITNIAPSTTTASNTAFTLKISGLSVYGNPRVLLGGLQLSVISTTYTLIVAQVPASLNQIPGTYTVQVFGYSPIGITVGRLTILPGVNEPPIPQITRITPSILSASGGTITISGNGFSLGARVSFGSRQLTILSSSATQITAVVPANLPFGYYVLSVVNPDGVAAFQPINYGVNSVFAPSENTSLYPNPATTALTLETTLDRAATRTLTLRNVMGAPVLEERHTAASGRFSTTLDVSALASGVYVLEVSDGVGHWAQKVVKY